MMGKKICARMKVPMKKQYPSAEFLYSVCLEDYNRVVANYDRIYDRINIALTLCSVLLIAILNDFKTEVFVGYCSLTCGQRAITVGYLLLSLASIVLMVVAVVQYLLLSRGKVMLSFDSNCIKEQELYEEQVEDAALWIILQYLKSINSIRVIVDKKQKKFNTATIWVIVAIFAYVASKFIGSIFYGKG